MIDLTPEEARRIVTIDPDLRKIKEAMRDYLEGHKSLEETLKDLRRIYCTDEIGIVITACREEFKTINAQALGALLKEFGVQ